MRVGYDAHLCSADLQVGVGNVEARTYAHLEVGATIDRNVWYGVARVIGRICSADFQSASVAMRVGNDAHLCSAHLQVGVDGDRGRI